MVVMMSFLYFNLKISIENVWPNAIEFSQSCPISCSAGYLFCPGISDPSDPASCPSPDSCVAAVDPATGCPAHCPVQCPTGQRSCPGIRIDHCPAQEICVPDGTVSERFYSFLSSLMGIGFFFN